MSKIFKPRRFLRSTAKTSSGSKRTTVLAAGEMAMVGKTAIGSNSRADLYLGDGTTQIQNLKPAIYGDTSEEDITITADSSTTASAALGNVVTGKTLGALLGSLKQAISLNTSSISSLNDEMSGKASTSHTHDDRYYTESEMDTKLAGKSDTNHSHSGYASSSHTHAWSSITGKPSTYTAGNGTATYAGNSGTSSYASVAGSAGTISSITTYSNNSSWTTVQHDDSKSINAVYCGTAGFYIIIVNVMINNTNNSSMSPFHVNAQISDCFNGLSSVWDYSMDCVQEFQVVECMRRSVGWVSADVYYWSDRYAYSISVQLQGYAFKISN